MLSGKALVYAVIVTLLNAILIAALLTLLGQTINITEEHIEQNRAVRNVQSGLEYILSLDKEKVFPQIIDLFDQQEDPVIISKYNWGLFKVGYTKAWIPGSSCKDTISKAILIGHSGAKSLKPALYVANLNKAVYIAGNTKICGEALVPGGALQPGIAGGKNDLGRYSIHGETHSSSMFLPDVQKDYLKGTKALFDSITAEPVVREAIVGNSFYQPVLCFASDELSLSNQAFRGNILLKASKRIVVESSCQLDDVILYAPEIIIKNGFSGRLQAFATKKIVVGQNSMLSYPSVLCLLRTFPDNDTLSVTLDRGAKVDGCVLAWSLEYSPVRSKIVIAKESQVNGQVFSDGWVDIQGRISGNLTCAGLLYQTPVSYMENYLVDATLNRCALGKNYISPFFEKAISKEQVIKWLY